MLGGTLAAPAIVRRAGHIRAFAAFVAASVVIVIFYPILVAPAAWLVMRAGLGFAFRRALRHHRNLAEFESLQRQSRRALRHLPDRQL